MGARSRRAEPEVIEQATVVGLTHEGAGIVRDGKAAFVAGALPGESIRFRRTRHHKQHDDAELVEVLEPSPSRVAPKCAHFGVCGGCALQHLLPEAQLDAKEAELRAALERVGRVSPAQWLPPLLGPVWGYRRRARLGAKFVAKKDRVVVGFRERLAPYVAEVHTCEVLAPPVGALVAPLAQLFTGLSIRQQLPQIEVAVADNCVALVLRTLTAPSADDIEQLRAFERTHAIRFYLQPGGLDSVRPLTRDAASNTALRYGLPAFGVQLEFTPTDFIQINGAINEALVSRAVELLELTPAAVVLDLYCGIGNFTLALAKRAARVVGVEGAQVLVQRARHNATLNGSANAEFHVADLAQPPDPAAAWLSQPYTHVLLDPPRAGALEMLAPIARLAACKVLYISCHPGSLARDVGMLVHEHGMKVMAAGVLDMFPHTTHLESLVLLEHGGRTAGAS